MTIRTCINIGIFSAGCCERRKKRSKTSKERNEGAVQMRSAEGSEGCCCCRTIFCPPYVDFQVTIYLIYLLWNLHSHFKWIDPSSFHLHCFIQSKVRLTCFPPFVVFNTVLSYYHVCAPEVLCFFEWKFCFDWQVASSVLA